MSRSVKRAEIEDLLFLEAELLDDWKLPEWLALFTNDATYEVPATDLPPDANSNETLFLIADDHPRLVERVKRLMSKSAHAEFPRSKTRHLVSNVRILAQDDETVTASAAFVTFRTKGGHTDTFMGSHRYRLRKEGDSLLIRAKTIRLDLDGLRPQGRVSILL